MRNLGVLIEAMFKGKLDEVKPEVRDDQLALCAGLVTGPGGPDGQKGYPWSCTRGEPLEIDFNYMKRKGIQVIPSARSRWMVVTKFNPVRIDEKPSRKTAIAASETLVPVCAE